MERQKVQEVLKDLQFLENQISEILKKRCEFEDLLKTNKCVYEDYTAYLQSILKLAKLKLNPSRTRNQSLQHLMQEINELYKRALKDIPKSYTIWQSYLTYCKRIKAKDHIKKKTEEMIQNCGDREDTWLFILSLHDSTPETDTNTIEDILTRGLTVHETGKQLHKYAISFKLCQIKLNLQNTPSKDKHSLDLIEYINSMVRNIDDIEYYFEILNLCDSHNLEYAHKAKTIIEQELKKKYTNNPAMWDMLARRQNTLQLNKVTKHERKRLVQRIYEEGLKTIAVTERTELCSLYLTWLINETVQLGSIAKETNYDISCLNSAFEKAHENNCLAEEYYRWWFNLNDNYNWSKPRTNKQDNVSRTLEILDKGVEVYPHSVEMWELYVDAVIETFQRENTAKNIFERAVAALKEKSAPFWLTYIKYCNLKFDDDIIQDLYERAMQQPEEVSTALKPKYLEWLHAAKGIHETRQKYDELATKKPFLMELHRIMLKFEAVQLQSDYARWELVHKRAIEQFPQDGNLRFGYIRFLVLFKKSAQNEVKCAYDSAVRDLPEVDKIFFKNQCGNLEGFVLVV